MLELQILVECLADQDPVEAQVWIEPLCKDWGELSVALNRTIGGGRHQWTGVLTLPVEAASFYYRVRLEGEAMRGWGLRIIDTASDCVVLDDAELSEVPKTIVVGTCAVVGALERRLPNEQAGAFSA